MLPEFYTTSLLGELSVPLLWPPHDRIELLTPKKSEELAIEVIFHTWIRGEDGMKKREIHGYAGKILRVDLTTGSISYEPTITYAREWLGGAGINQWLLYQEVRPWATPYAPANRLAFGVGPLVGTLAPGASRISADSKNAYTFGVGSSNSDSHFGPELKFAGYDNLIFQGKARKPVYLWIKDSQVEIRDATHLWGKTTWETVSSIRQELGDERIQVVSIGPAGENLVRGACIIADRGRAFGRCGLGGVMGSKNLKAVAVRGKGEVQVADSSRFMGAVDSLLKRFSESKRTTRALKYGSPGAVTRKQEVGGIPYKNFQSLGLPDEAFKKFNLDDLQNDYMVRNVGYMACPAPCGRFFCVDQGPYAGLKTEGFQFAALADFAGKLAVEDPVFTIKINSYCNQLGLDIENVAGAIGWAMECYQRGILKEADLDGFKLEWGDAPAVLDLTRKIAYREGIGNILGEGCAYAADLIDKGSEYFAMHMKKQDLYEVIRGAVGWGLGACVSTRGGGHTTGSPSLEASMVVDEEVAERVYGVRTINQPLEYEGKAKLVWYFERLHRVNNSLGICHFTSSWSDPIYPGFPEIAELYSAATGLETTDDDLKTAAARILNVEKAFNLLNTDLSRKDDYPPPRDLQEPMPSGSAKGWKIEREKWDQLLDEYYEMNYWDKKTSFPTRKCLEDLNLKKVADDLEKIGKIG
jgi:aldehyde:ferredoxin oxidoreductase